MRNGDLQMFSFTEDQLQEFRKWTREHFSDSQLVDETLMFSRLTDNPDCVESCLCDFAVALEELFRDECVLRLAALTGTAVV